jgi:hypothetical protein
MLPLLVAICLGVWGLPPSLQPQPAQGVQNQTQPTQQNASAEPSVEKQKSESDQRAGKKENEQSRVERIVKSVREYNAEIVTISTAIMALFTIALFAATFALWFGGERHSRRELRAYVSVRPGFVFFFTIPPTANIVVQCVLTNHGQTPAFRINTAFDIGVFPSGLREPPHQAARVIADEAAIFPAANININLTNSRQLTDQEANQVVAGTHAIYVWGTTRYRDAFNNLRWTRFFAAAGGRNFFAAISATPPRGFHWLYGHQHNQAT